MLSNDKMDEKHNTADMLQRQPVPSYESAVLQSASATAAQPTLKEPSAVNPSERVSHKLTRLPATADVHLSLDLLAASQREANFLRMIDRKAPILYEEDIVRNAIRRYETCWLPLQVRIVQHQLLITFDRLHVVTRTLSHPWTYTGCGTVTCCRQHTTALIVKHLSARSSITSCLAPTRYNNVTRRASRWGDSDTITSTYRIRTGVAGTLWHRTVRLCRQRSTERAHHVQTTLFV